MVLAKYEHKISNNNKYIREEKSVVSLSLSLSGFVSVSVLFQSARSLLKKKMMILFVLSRIYLFFSSFERKRKSRLEISWCVFFSTKKRNLSKKKTRKSRDNTGKKHNNNIINLPISSSSSLYSHTHVLL